MPDDFFYQGHITGIVGVIWDLRGKARLKGAMQKGQIDVGQVVLEQFAAGLANAGIFSSIVAEGGDARVKLEVISFGFGPQLLGPGVKPMLVVTGTCVRRDGAVMWQRSESVTNLNSQTPSRTLGEYVQSPELIREAFTVASKVVVAALIKHMEAA